MAGVRFQHLDLSGTSVKDLTPLKGGLNEASTISLANMNLSKMPDIGWEDTGSLEKLDFSNNPISDFSFMRGISTLQEVNLAGTNGTDLSPFSHLNGGQVAPGIYFKPSPITIYLNDKATNLRPIAHFINDPFIKDPKGKVVRPKHYMLDHDKMRLINNATLEAVRDEDCMVQDYRDWKHDDPSYIPKCKKDRKYIRGHGGEALRHRKDGYPKLTIAEKIKETEDRITALRISEYYSKYQ